MKAAYLLVIASCVTEPSGYPIEASPAIEAGFREAVTCGEQHGLIIQHSPASLRLYLTPSLGDIRGSMRADDIRGQS